MIVPDQLVRHPLCQTPHTVEPHHVEVNRACRLWLDGDDEPVIGLGEAEVNRLIGVAQLGVNLTLLEGSQIQGYLVVSHRLPGEELRRRLEQVVKPLTIGGCKYEHVAVEALRRTAVLEELPGDREGDRVLGARVRGPHPQHH